MTASVIVARSAPRRPGRTKGAGVGGGGGRRGRHASRETTVVGNRLLPQTTAVRPPGLQPDPRGPGGAPRPQPRLGARAGAKHPASGPDRCKGLEADPRPRGTADGRVRGRRPRGKARLGLRWKGTQRPHQSARVAWEGGDRFGKARERTTAARPPQGDCSFVCPRVRACTETVASNGHPMNLICDAQFGAPLICAFRRVFEWNCAKTERRITQTETRNRQSQRYSTCGGCFVKILLEQEPETIYSVFCKSWMG